LGFSNNVAQRASIAFCGDLHDVSILQANGIRLRPEIDPKINGNAANFFGSTSDTFRITATGRFGRIEKKVTAVVRYDDALGKMLYWKED